MTKLINKMFLGALLVVFVSGLLIVGIDSDVTRIWNYSSSGTPVGGIIWENITWTLGNSLYTITARAHYIIDLNS